LDPCEGDKTTGFDRLNKRGLAQTGDLLSEDGFYKEAQTSTKLHTRKRLMFKGSREVKNATQKVAVGISKV